MGVQHICVLVKTVGKLDLTHGFYSLEGFQRCFHFIYGEVVTQCNTVILCSEEMGCHSEPRTECEQM